MKRVRRRFRGAPSGLTALLAFALLGGCGEKESLIVVTASTSDNYVTGLHTLLVSAGKTQKSFQIPQDITAGLNTVGLYVPSSVIGSAVKVTVQAVSDQCGPGYSGSTTVDIAAAGTTVDAQITMIEAMTCPNGGRGGTGGTVGTGGTGGTGGTAGTGGTTVPNCTEIDHESAGTCASCTVGGTGDVAIYGVAFSPTNHQLVVTGASNSSNGTNGSVKVWTVGSNGALAPEGHVLTGAGLNVVAFSPDGSALAVGRTGKVDIMDVSNWTVSSTVNVTGDTYGVGFSPDASMLIALSVVSTGSTASTSTATLAAFPAGSPQTPFTVTIPEGYALGVSPATVGGALPVAVTTVSGSMEVFNLTSSGFSPPATVTVTLDNSFAETAVFAPQGNLLASGGDDGLLDFWSVPVAAGAASDAFPINIFADTVASTEVWSAAFSPDQTYIAVGGGGFADNDSGNGSLTIWNVADPRNAASSEYDTSRGYDVVSLAYSSAGDLIVGGESNCGCVLVCPQ